MSRTLNLEEAILAFDEMNTSLTAADLLTVGGYYWRHHLITDESFDELVKVIRDWLITDKVMMTREQCDLVMKVLEQHQNGGAT